MSRPSSTRRSASYDKDPISHVSDSQQTSTKPSQPENTEDIVVLPPHQRLRTLNEPVTASAVGQKLQSLQGAKPIASEVFSVERLLQYGCFQSRPKYYLDLFIPLINFFVCYMRPRGTLMGTEVRKCPSLSTMDDTFPIEADALISFDVYKTPKLRNVVNSDLALAHESIERDQIVSEMDGGENDRTKRKYIRAEQKLVETDTRLYHYPSAGVNSSHMGACPDGRIQTPPEATEHIKAQIQLMKVLVFPMTVFPYFASQTLGDVSAEVASKHAGCGFTNTRGSCNKYCNKPNDVSLRHRKLVNDDGSDQIRKGGEQSWPEVGEDFDQLLKKLEDSCHLYYNVEKLRKLMHLLSNEVASLYLLAFLDDNAYLMGKEATFVMEHWCRSASHGKFTTNLFALAHKTGLNLFEQVVPCIQAVTGLVRYHTHRRLSLMSLKPRVQRVGSFLHLSAKEVDSLTFLLLCHCGAMLCASINGPQTPLTMAHHMNLTPKELMWFLSEHRAHMKQGLITSDARQRSSFIESHVAMPQEVVTALTGYDLTEEQLIKLERTALAEVLNIERRQHEQQSKMASGAIGDTLKRARSEIVKQKKRARGDPEHSNKRALLSPGPVLPPWEEDEHATSDEQDEIESVFSSDNSITEHGGDLERPSSGDSTLKQDSMLPTTSPSAQIDQVTKFGNADGDGWGCNGEGTGVVQNNTSKDDDDLCDERACDSNGALAVALFGEKNQEITSDGNVSTYKTDFEYMEAAFNLISTFIRIRTAEGDIKDDEDCYQPKTKLEATLRELKGRQRVWMAVHKRRVQATLNQHAKGNAYLPRIEQLSKSLHLNELEKQVLLLMVGNVVSHDILIAINGRYGMRDGQRVLTVGYILFVLCENLQERIAVRKSFYKSSPLISNSILSLSLDTSSKSRFNTDLMDYICDIDRKIVDYLMGIETETAEMVPGSRLYSPTVTIKNVVLPAQTTDLVLSTIENYGLFERCKTRCGFGKGLGSSASGLVILFYGPSGTGKTMLANAVAHELKKKILLVTVSEFRSDKNAAEMMNFIFREARLNNNAIIFFDECESLFETREVNPLVTSLLSDFEKYEGLVIMATNKAQNMDEAMNRRISLMIEFKLPGHEMRESIWRHHIPPELKLQKDVRLDQLAMNYELSGGLIRNAVLAALHHAVAREKSETPTLTMEDLEGGAKQQLRGFFLASQLPSGANSKFYITPKSVLSELVLKETTRKQIETIAKLAKSRSTLFSQWGFSQDACENLGAIYLFSGPSGAGKSLAAEGIAFDCGATIRLCNLAELMLLHEVSIHTVFEEARSLGAIVVFDQAQGLFNHSERSISISQMIQYHAMRYPRPVIIIATTRASWERDRGTMMGDSTSWIDVQASRLVFSMHVVFHLPSRELRKELWTKAFPSKVPLAEDVDFEVLSNSVVSGKMIQTVAFSVCCRIALLPESRRKLDMKTIQSELEAAMLRERGHNSCAAMFA